MPARADRPRGFWWLALLFLIQSAAIETIANDTSINDKLTDLAKDPVWLQLLHYDLAAGHSEIKSSEFFLSPAGKQDPLQELRATLRQYARPWDDNPDQHARCRFPARYYWLNQHLELPDYESWQSRCGRFNRWARLDSLQSVSLLLVSGYFGNPASAFGHSLLKLNTTDSADPLELFDLSINFGALVPENEGTLPYVIRGLFGGYRAGFSDRYFYTQDLVYSRTEYRDIWAYQLNLSRSQRELLVMHLWEIVQKQYDYYFLTQNCAYRLAKLLELVTGESFTERSGLWYLPVETFHRLIDIDTRRRVQNDEQLIRAVRFIPSSRRSLHRDLSNLSAGEIDIAKRIIDAHGDTAESGLATLAEQRQGLVLDALLSYYKFRLVAEQPDPDPRIEREKQRILIARLRLPERTEPLPVIRELPSPASDSRPMIIGLGVAEDKDGESYTILRWSPYSEEWLGINSGEGDEFALLDVVLAVPNDNDIFLDRVDLLRVRKLNLARSYLGETTGLSWELQIGSRQLGRLDDRTGNLFVRAGLGKAWAANPDWALYAMASIEADDEKPTLSAIPYLGLYRRTGKFRLHATAGLQWDDDSGWRENSQAALQYNFSSRRSIRFRVASNHLQRASMVFNWQW